MKNQHNNAIEEVLSTLQQLQAMEIHPDTGIIEISKQPFSQDYQTQAADNRHQSLVVHQVYQEHLRKIKRRKKRSVFMSALMGMTISGGAISYIVYNDQRAKEKEPEIVSKFNSPDEITSTLQHERQTDALLKRIQNNAENRISIARQLLLNGEIRSARHILLDITKTDAKFSNQTFAQAALALANTFDPNVLSKITDADEDPDVLRARYWYQQWHEANVKAGIATDSSKLDQVLSSLK